MKLNLKIAVLFVIYFLGMTTLSVAQKGGPNQQDLKRSFEFDLPISFQTNQLDSLITWQERIIMHVDKLIITENQPLFFKAYTLTGPKMIRATLSKVLKVELLNSDKDIVAIQYHKIKDGIVEGAFNVPKNLKEGVYTLRAYTRWLENYGEAFYFSTDLTLGKPKFKENAPIADELVQVSFHPEGGNLIENLSNRLLIKALDSNQRPIDLEGAIVNSEGEIMMPISSFGEGVMSVIFTPDSKERYWFKIDSGVRYELPPALSSGYLLNVNNLNTKMLNVRVQSTSKMPKGKIWLQGVADGTTYFKQELLTKRDVNDFEISVEGIPAGVMTISLVDELDETLASRPVTVDNPKALNISIAPMTNTNNGDELTFKVKVTDEYGAPISTAIALSASNSTENPRLNYATMLGGFTWERDDLENGIETTARKNRFVRDLRLLTSDDLAAGELQFPKRVKYPFQTGLDLFGYTYDLDNNLVKNTRVQIINMSGTNSTIQEFETDNNGNIRIEGLDLSGENDLVFVTSGDETESRKVKIVPIQEHFEQKDKAVSVFEINAGKSKTLIQPSPWQSEDLGVIDDNTIELDEVEVIEEKLKEKNTAKELYGMVPERIIMQDSVRPKPIPNLLVGVAGVRVVNVGTTEPSMWLSTAAGGDGPLLYVLDGVPLERYSLVDVMELANFTEIERIEILYAYQSATIFGSRAPSGAFLMYTKARMDYVKKKESRFKFQGYNISPTFDDFAAKVAKKPKKFKDKATTLFWDPNIQTNENGEAIVRFSTPVEYKQLEIKASAVTETGKVGSARIVL